MLAVELTAAGADDPVLGRAAAQHRHAAVARRHVRPARRAACCWRRRRPTPHQAYRVGPVAYAVQFHVEVTEAMGEEWADVPAYAEYADRVLGPGGSDRLLVEFRAGSPRMQVHARAISSAGATSPRPASSA